jgi:hypothetical protein
MVTVMICNLEVKEVDVPHFLTTLLERAVVTS